MFHYMPSFSLAIFAPFTRFAIFWKAMSLAKSGLPCFGFASIENGENPQSSVARSWSFGMYLLAATMASHMSSGFSTCGFNGFTTPTNATCRASAYSVADHLMHTCFTPFASLRIVSPISLYTFSLPFQLASWMRKYPAFIWNMLGRSSW